MIGIIVLPGPTAAMHRLDEHAPLSLLPLGDRPILQHIVEFLAHQGITCIDLLLEHAPESVESLLGDGARWGCQFRYHLVADPEFPYKPLRVIQEAQTGPCLLVHADQFPLVSLDQFKSANTPVVFSTEDARLVKEGAVFFPAGVAEYAFVNGTRAAMQNYLQSLLEQNKATAVPVSLWVDATTPASLLRSQKLLLERQLDNLMVGGIENDRGVWISRNVVIHPSVKIVSPVYIGPNCRLNRGARIGPNVVISSNCIVDSHTTVQNSLLTSGSYVGQGLELEDSIVDRNLLVNVRLDTRLNVTEDFLLGKLSMPAPHHWLRTTIEPLIAVILMVLFLPFFFIALCGMLLRRKWPVSVQVLKLPADDSAQSQRFSKLWFVPFSSWEDHVPAGWSSFLWRFLPGLFTVACGGTGFVGLSPRTSEQLRKMPSDWKSLYLRSRTGLITESSIVVGANGGEMEIYLAEACYAATRSWKHDLKLALLYFLRLVLPAARPEMETQSQEE
jgi:NDP-sugar pyrophosphorylase family protein